MPLDRIATIEADVGCQKPDSILVKIDLAWEFLAVESGVVRVLEADLVRFLDELLRIFKQPVHACLSKNILLKPRLSVIEHDDIIVGKVGQML